MKPTSKSPVVLSVADIRDAIYHASGGTKGPGAASNALLGGLFHEVCASMLNPDSPCRWQIVLGEGELGDHKKLLHHAYQNILGPRLSSSQAVVQGVTEEVLALWKATSALCRWTCDLLSEAAVRNLVRYDAERQQWTGSEDLVSTEQQLTCEFTQPGWSRRVLVSGIPDAIWRKPSGEWCVIEYKLGQGSPEADLAQAALYVEMIASGQPADAGAALALVRFTPEVEERVYTASELAETRKALRALIGQLGGVTEDTPAPSYQAPPKTPEPADQIATELELALADHGAPGSIVGDPVTGPSFLRYYVELQRGIPVRRVLAMGRDLQVRLCLSEVPFIQVDAGRVAIDLQRPDRETVTFSSIEPKLPPPDVLTGSALVPVGLDVSGHLRFANLADPIHAHALVAGTAGSGKTEWLRTAIAGLIARNTPDTMRLLLIDPKRNAFLDLKDSAFLLTPIVFPPDDSAVEVLAMLADEMDERYRHIAPWDSVEQYARKTGDRKPRIVCVCDEYADLVLTSRQARKQIETLIARLGAKARAAGIHLILATQRPSRDLVAGALAANMTCRVGLKTNSHIESRMVVLESGAENLLGRGDLLFRDSLRAIRLQGAILTEDDRRRWLVQSETRTAKA